jgi:hypothetical protein
MDGENGNPRREKETTQVAEDDKGDDVGKPRELRFGFVSNSNKEEKEEAGGGTHKEQGSKLFFGDDRQQQLQDLQEKSRVMAIDMTIFIKSLRNVINDACSATESNLKAYANMAQEVGLVVDANVKSGEDLVQSVVATSLEVSQIQGLRKEVERLESALSLYEETADALIERTDKRSLRASKSSKR